MSRFNNLLVVVCVVFAAANSDSRGQSLEEAQLAEAARLADALQSDAPVYDKAMACRRLAVIGQGGSAAALGRLLADPQLATYARSALEAIPDEEAGAELRRASSRLTGELLIGVVGSLGKRGEATAVADLDRLLTSNDMGVAAAAAKALGKIGDLTTAATLERALGDVDDALRPVLAYACLACGDRLLGRGEKDRAIELFHDVSQAAVPSYIALAATQREIVVRGRGGLSLLGELLGSTDERRFDFALQAARQLGASSTETLAAHLAEANAGRQALLIGALRDIDDVRALPAIRRLARQGRGEARWKAIQAVGEFAAAADAGLLISIALDADAASAAAARAALVEFPSDEVDVWIDQMLDDGPPNARRAAIFLAGARRTPAAFPKLLRLSQVDDGNQRLAAIESLGRTAELDDLADLIAFVLQRRTDEEKTVARRALSTACARLPREACVAELATAVEHATSEGRSLLLEQAAVVGGPRALDLVVDAAKSEDDALQDTATRLLGEWLTADAAPELLSLAETHPAPKYRIRALRGYIRVARQLNMSDAERIAVCRQALEAAERDEERVLVLEVLARIRAPESLALAAAELEKPGTRAAAGRAIVAMSDALSTLDAEQTAAALARVIATVDDSVLQRQASQQLSKIRGRRQLP